MLKIKSRMHKRQFYKFQSLIVGNNDNQMTEFHINDGFRINVRSEVTLLGIQIDEQLKRDSLIGKVCKKLP